MNIPEVRRYKYDNTGVDTENYVSREPHVVEAGRINKVFCLVEGPFYADSLVIEDSDGNELVPYRDYRPMYIYPEACEQTGKSVVAFVKILNESFAGTAYCSYQVVGGRFGMNSEALVDILEAIINDDRPIYWNDIQDKPDRFPPTEHTHDIRTTYGWGSLIDAINDITLTIVNQQTVSDDDLYETIRALRNHLTTLNSQVLAKLNNHAYNTNNPHQDNKNDVDLGNVDNFATASKQDTIDGTRDDLFVTPMGLGGALDDRVDKLDSNVLHQGRLPISRYGNLNYLPPGVTGTFEGSAQFDNEDARPVCLEPDGTLVRLRPGTNSTSLGVYYDYIINAFKGGSPGKFIKTNAVYQPPGLSGYKPYTLFKSGNGCLFGKAYQISKYPMISSRWFIAITNGTFDTSQHNVAFIDQTSFPINGTNRTLSNYARAELIGNYVYIFDYTARNGRLNRDTTPFGFIVWRVPVSDIINKSVAVPEALTKWTTTGTPYGNQSGDDIRLAPTTTSYDANDKPLFLNDSNAIKINPLRQSMKFVAMGDESNSNIIYFGFNTATDFATDQTIQVANWGVRIKIFVNERRAEVQDNLKAFNTKIGSTNATLTLDNQNYAFKFKAETMIPGGYGGDEHGQHQTLPNGWYYKHICGNILNNGLGVRFGQYDSEITSAKLWDFLNTKYHSVTDYPDEPVFGSAIGNSLQQPVMLGNNRILLKTAKLTPKNTLGETVQRASYGGTQNFTYSILRYGNLAGYPPTSDRVDHSFYDYNNRMITYVNGGSVVNWGAILTQYSDTAPESMDVNGVPSAAVITWDKDELVTKGKALAKTLYGNNVTDCTCDVFIPQDTSLPILYSLVTVVKTSDSAKDGYIAVGTVSYSGSRTGKITGYVLDSSGVYSAKTVNGNAVRIDDKRYKQPGLVIYKSGSDFLCAISNAGSVYIPDPGYVAKAILFAVTNKTITPNNNNPVIYINPYDVGTGTYPIAIPGRGLCIVDNDVNGPAGNGVLACSIAGSNKSDFLNWNYSNKTNLFVLMAQQVEQGWSVYFNEETPVLLAGNEYMTPVTSINLTKVKANPANTTFYVYVRLDQDQVIYDIRTAPIAESMANMFIGTVVTNATQIASINVNKVSRLDTYRTSLTRIGSAISVSSGLPMQKGDWAWMEDFSMGLVGAPQPWPQTTPPTGWLACQGQSFNTSAYPKLAKAYPNGVLPDLRGYFIRGYGGSSGGILAAQGHSIAWHNHNFGATSTWGGDHGHGISGSTTVNGQHTHRITMRGTKHSGDDSSITPDGDRGANYGMWTDPDGQHSHSLQASASTSGGHNHTVNGTTGNQNQQGGDETRPMNKAFLYVVEAK